MKTSTDASKIADTIAQEYVNTNISVQPTMDFLQDQINTVNTILSILIISYQANIFVVLTVLIVTFLVQLATTVGPIMRLRKINIVEELKYE